MALADAPSARRTPNSRRRRPTAALNAEQSASRGQQANRGKSSAQRGGGARLCQILTIDAFEFRAAELADARRAARALGDHGAPVGHRPEAADAASPVPTGVTEPPSGHTEYGKAVWFKDHWYVERFQNGCYTFVLAGSAFGQILGLFEATFSPVTRQPCSK